jgi:hypothetical protein
MTFTNALREKPSKTVMGNQEPGSKAEKQTLDYLFSVTYEELRRLASATVAPPAKRRLETARRRS